MNKEEKQLYIQGVFGLVEFPPRIMFKDWCIINSEKRKTFMASIFK